MSVEQAIAWFCYKDENQFNELKSVFLDADKLPATFDRWEKLTEHGISIQEAQGTLVIKTYPESADDFITFCRHHGKSLSSEGRIHFANIKAAEYLRRR